MHKIKIHFFQKMKKSIDSYSNFNFSKKLVMYAYEVNYLVTGWDHDGYCSGEDRNTMEKLNRPEQLTIQRPLVDTITELDFFEKGCTSHRSGKGSGYCRGAGQNHRAIRVLSICPEDESEISENENRDEGEVDDRDEFSALVSRLNCE